MTCALTATLPMPPSLNNAYPTGRGGKRFLSPEARAFKEAAGWRLKAAARSWQPEKGARLALALVLHFPDARRRDLDNRVKLVQDALAAVLGLDDCTVDRLTVTRGEPDKQNPRCELTVEALA